MATGGTISDREGTRLSAEEVIKAVPGLEHYATAEFEQFANTSTRERPETSSGPLWTAAPAAS